MKGTCVKIFRNEDLFRLEGPMSQHFKPVAATRNKFEIVVSSHICLTAGKKALLGHKVSLEKNNGYPFIEWLESGKSMVLGNSRSGRTSNIFLDERRDLFFLVQDEGISALRFSDGKKLKVFDLKYKKILFTLQIKRFLFYMSLEDNIFILDIETLTLLDTLFLTFSHFNAEKRAAKLAHSELGLIELNSQEDCRKVYFNLMLFLVNVKSFGSGALDPAIFHKVAIFREIEAEILRKVIFV